MKLIHCADLHLDSKMESLPYETAVKRRYEILRTFGRLTRAATENNVDVVLLCGDVFDAERVSEKTISSFLEEIRIAKDTDFLYLPGNHDRDNVFAGFDLPENLKVFTESWQYFTYGDVVIAGLKQTESNCKSKMYQNLALSDDKTNIVALHGQISSTHGLDEVCVQSLREKPIDYLALGHIHQYREGQLSHRGLWCYSGCLEGRGFDELGEKGYVQIEVTGRSLKHAFAPFAQRTLQLVSVDITGLNTSPLIRQTMQEKCSGIPSECLVKFELTGKHGLDSFVDLSFLEQETKDWFFFSKIQDKTELSVDSSEYAHDISLKGEFLRVVEESDLDDDEKARVIKAGLAAIMGEEVAL